MIDPQSSIQDTQHMIQDPNLLGKEYVKNGSEEIVGVAEQEEEH